MTATRRPPEPARVAAALLAALLALFAAAPANFLDPVAGFDDYPTLFGWLSAYYGKTLSEGRWVNFLWQYWVGPMDRHAAFWLVTLAWCALCAIIAASVFRGDARPWRAALFAAALALAPPFGALIPWANSLVPVLLVLLAYVAVAAWARPAVAATALLVFAPLGLMTYTTSPMVMALALELCGDWRGILRASALVALLALGVALGLLAIYVANWRVHGVFGVVADAWREPTPATDAAGVAENLGRAAEQARGNLLAIVHPAVWAGLAAFLAAPFLAYAAIPRRSLPIFGVVAAGMGLLILNLMLNGVTASIRAWVFAWMGFVALFAVMAREAPRRGVSAGFLAVVALLAVGGGWFWQTFFDRLEPFQARTRAIAEDIAEAAPGDGPVLVHGRAHSDPAVRATHNRDWARDWSLAFRLHVLTGREACICGWPLGRADLGYCPDERTAGLCEATAPAAAALAPSGEGPAVGAGPGGAAVVRFPD